MDSARDHTSDSAPSTGQNENENNKDDSFFECNVCLETVKEPVVTPCGHLYCWPCIYKWLELYPDSPSCPVCKAAITKDKLIPLYGRGREQTDPRNRRPADIPNRPQGQRGESVRQSSPQRDYGHDFFGAYPGMGGPFGHGMYHTNVGGFNFGFGFFPPLFGMNFTTGTFSNGPAMPHRPLTPQELQQQQISRMLFILGILILFFFLIV